VTALLRRYPRTVGWLALNAVLAVVVTVAACGDDDEAEPPPLPPPVEDSECVRALSDWTDDQLPGGGPGLDEIVGWCVDWYFRQDVP
jgi:hypothetical protein